MLKKIIAYKNNSSQITYAELREKAEFYGELLKRQGSGPVIIYGHKSVDMFVSIFACLHSGRAYVPVDVFTPVKRIEKIITLTGSTLIIANEELDISNVEVLALSDLTKYKDCSEKEVSGDTAYIIFTSGSTGEPKGVPISRGNLKNFIGWINSLSPLRDYKNINVLNQASFSFDLSVADIFYSVSNGHTLVAADGDLTAMFDTLKDIDLIVATPTFIKLCMVNPDFNAQNFPRLKCIYFCGEQLEVRVAKSLFERFFDLKIINAYGPTEATSAVSAINITRDMLNGELLPVGEVGKFATDIFIDADEIVLKGESVFSGYLGSESRVECYKTGDVGYIKDGKLYVKGRCDSQIKYKGYRIELYDIENNLYKIGGVKECAVVAKYKDEFNVKMIKAFVVPDGVDIDTVKRELKKLVPPYMMPRVIVPLEKMPVNSNGKTDRKRLSEL